MSFKPSVTLCAADLYSKWGFRDGELLSELDLKFCSSGVLIKVVETYLLPRISAIEVDHVATTHNPIRARDYDPNLHDTYAAQRRSLEHISVMVTAEDVRAAIATDITTIWPVTAHEA